MCVCVCVCEKEGPKQQSVPGVIRCGKHRAGAMATSEGARRGAAPETTSDWNRAL